MYNLGIIFLISPLKHILHLSLEPFRQDGSDEWSQHMSLLRNNIKISLNYLQYPFLSGVKFERLFGHRN